MKNTKNKKHKKYFYLKRIFGISGTTIVFLYLILLIPEGNLSITEHAQNQPFIWNQDSLWFALEERFIKARQSGCDQLSDSINESLLSIHNLLDTISSHPLQPDARQFSVLEDAMFSLAPLIGACLNRLTDYIELFSRLRYIVKTQSLGWNMNNVAARQTIYRLIYGGRAAISPHIWWKSCCRGVNASGISGNNVK